MSLKTDAKLALKKHRTETGLFIVEGRKGILELLSSDFKVVRVYATITESELIDSACATYQERTGNPSPIVTIVNEKTLTSLGTLETSSAGLAVARMRTSIDEASILAVAQSAYVLVLDDIQDPGNLGTIIRTADWFGITHIVTSPTTVDVYNPKVIRASMGSFTRTCMTELPLESLLLTAKEKNIPSYGAFLSGTSVHETRFEGNGFIVMGSESHGIQEELRKQLTHEITIPKHGHAESLNVAIATGVILATLRK
jgi:RNA methyltransferase, TrmH family